MEALNEAGGSLPLRDVKKAVAQKVTLDEHDLARYDKTGYIRWESVLHFYSIDAVKAGFIRKSGGRWHLTDEGREALKLPAKELLDEAVRRYRLWKDEQPTENEAKPPELTRIEEEAAVEATERAFVLETAEADAIAEIEDYVKALGPYDFQELVAALLRLCGLRWPVSLPMMVRGGRRPCHCPRPPRSRGAPPPPWSPASGTPRQAARRGVRRRPAASQGTGVRA
jgi:restriction system protein